MIDHSLGAGTTLWAAAYDSRIKVSVLSYHVLGGLENKLIGGPLFYRGILKGLFYQELLELIAPKVVVATRGKEEVLFNKLCDFASKKSENSVLK